MSGSIWRPLLSGIVTFVLISVVDGFISGSVGHSAEGAFVRIVLAAIVFAGLLLAARKSSDERKKQLLYGVAGGVAAYALGQVSYTPLYSTMRQTSSNLQTTTEP